jgi:uncharacterized membrane protein YozB (DUF420 family)
MTIADLPTLNACLNATSAILVFVGRRLILKGNRSAHKKFMIAAVCVSVAFLISYLIYHYFHGSTPFRGEGWIRPVYFTILLSHTVLATVIVPLVIITLSRGLRDLVDKHRRVARWTYPLWLYVSVTGVVIYFMLYHLHA